jgi:hypothetical protein
VEFFFTAANVMALLVEGVEGRGPAPVSPAGRLLQERLNDAATATVAAAVCVRRLVSI